MAPPSSIPDAAPRLTLLGQLVAASLAASTAVIFTNPLETAKTRLQLDGEAQAGGAARPRQYAGVTDALRRIASREGVRGLQAGLSAACLYQCVMNGTRLGGYEPLQRALREATGAGEHSTAVKVAAAAATGAVGAALGSPLFLIKARLQAQSPDFVPAETHAPYRGLWDGLTRVWRQEGARGLLRGVDGAIPRVCVGSAVQLVSYDACRRELAGRGLREGSPGHTVAAALLSSFATVTAMHPIDVVSSRMYLSAGRQTRYAGPLDCLRQTLAIEGARALWKGWAAQYARLGPHMILTFAFLEALRPQVAQVAAFCDGGGPG